MLFQKISNIYKNTRQWFYDQNFIEIRTNILTRSPGWDSYFTPFSTNIKIKNSLHPYFLSSSPEFEMKKFFQSKAERFFQITKSFRNGEIDEIHLPEFNMLEWYKNNSDYKDAMQDTENLILSLIESPNKKIDFTKPFLKFSVNELFQKHLNIDLNRFQDNEDLRDKALSLGFSQIKTHFSWDTIFFILFLEKIEPWLAQINKPIFLYDYPKQIASLAKNNLTHPNFVERFELYITGIEICNGYSELLDLNEHYKRYKQINALRLKNKMTELPFPEELVDFCNLGLSNVSGVALGMDRLIMILTDKYPINEIQPIPIFKNQP